MPTDTSHTPGHRRRAIRTIEVVLFLGTVASRLPFTSRVLYHWDSVNFAYALQRFDVAAEQPQPPGYILYVWLARLVDAFLHDAQVSMVLLSILASGLAVVALYRLGQALFDERTGLAAALFLASSPLFWFYGEIALPHTVDTLFVILAAWALYALMRGQRGALWVSAVVLAVAGGLRQQTAVFLAPLALYAGWRGTVGRDGWGRGLRRVALAVALFTLLCLAWFVPLVQSAGGLARYREVMGTFAARFNATTSVFMGAGTFGLIRNLRKLTMYTLYGWGMAALPFGLALLAVLVRRRRPALGERVVFLALWALPALGFYTLIHMGQQGLVFVYLPVLLLISAAALPPRHASRFTFLLVALNAAIFLLMPEHPLGNERFRLLTRQTVQHNDTYYRSRFQAIRETFPPERTVIVAARWRHVQYYLPEYRWLPFSLGAKWEVNEGRPDSGRIATGSYGAADLGLEAGMTVVLFDPDLDAFIQASGAARTLPLKDGGTMTYLSLGPGELLELGPRGIAVELAAGG